MIVSILSYTHIQRIALSILLSSSAILYMPSHTQLPLIQYIPNISFPIK